MLRLIRLSLAFLLLAVVCAGLLQTTHTQSPIIRITHTAEEGTNINPSMSGDGEVIAFESTEDLANAGGIDSFRALRANVFVNPISFAQLAAARAPSPALSQDGSHIAFASKDNPLSTNSDGNSEIFFYDGSKLIQLTNTSPGDISLRSVNGNFLPSISDDGRYIAFSSNRNLTDQNADGNLEIFICDTTTLGFTQLTNSTDGIGATDVKISGDSTRIVYLRESSEKRDLVLQNRVGPPTLTVLAADDHSLAMTYGRAISDDGQRVVWSAETANNTTQVFLFDGRNEQTRQLTNLGARASDVPLHPTISGDGSRIAFATRRSVAGMGSNSDGSVELYTFDIPSGRFGRVTDVASAKATGEVISSLNDNGAAIAFNYSRLLSGAVANEDFASNSEIYLASTPLPPTSGTLNIHNRASMGHELSSIKAIAPDSIAVAFGSSLSFGTEQPRPITEGVFPLSAAGTTVTVNGRPARVLFASPTEVHFHVPTATEVGSAEVVVTNSDGFPSRGLIATATAAPGVFSRNGDGLGAGMILDAEMLTTGPFDPTSGKLQLIIFATGIRNGSTVSVSAGGRPLSIARVERSSALPGLDEIHVDVPVELRGTGLVELAVKADGRDSNPVFIDFSGDSRRDILINEFLADPPDGVEGDANQDGVTNTSQDEFVELINTTNQDIDVGGYQLLTRTGSGSVDLVRHTFPSGTIVPPCTSIVVFGGGNFDPHHIAFGGAQVFKASSGSLGLANSAGVLTVFDSSAKVHGFVAYGGLSGIDAGDNQSITRAPDINGSFTKHQFASEVGRRFSPGTYLNGPPFETCAPAIVRIEISPPAAKLEINEKQLFTARAFDQNNNVLQGVIFRWQTSNSGVFTVDQNGVGTAISAGSAQITASGRGATSTAATIEVKPPPPVLTSVSISPSNATLAVGESHQFVAVARDQFGQSIGVKRISFSTTDDSITKIDSVTVQLIEGTGTAVITTHATGVAEIRASAMDGSVTITSAPATITGEPAAGDLLISEFRTRGPAGAADEFVEVYNPTLNTLHIGGLKIRASNNSGNTSDRIAIPSGRFLGPGCHYLVANNSSSGYSGSSPPDQAYLTGLSDDGGVAITGSNGTRIIDAVGMSNGSSYREGSSLAPLTSNADRSYERRPGGAYGNGIDSDNNAANFLLSATGSNPQNQASTCLDLRAADLSITTTGPAAAVVIGTDATYVITVTNNGAGLAEFIVVTDNLPPSLAFLSCVATGNGACVGSGSTLTVSFPALKSGETVVISLTARATGPAGTFVNSTSVISTTPDPNPDNNSATATTVLQASPPELSITDVSAPEGDSGSRGIVFTIRLSAPAPADIVFDVSTSDDTATSTGHDYLSQTLLRQKIPIGELEYKFPVEVTSDILVEEDESFVVNVTNVSGAVVIDDKATATITNDDVPVLVISQLYGGGGNSGAQFSNDFVEIFNRGKTIIDFSVTPYAVQYAGATANFGSNRVNLTRGTILPGQYFLVQLGGGPNGAPLPHPDEIGSVVMAATTGKVALTKGTTNLSGSGCPIADSVVDFVGYGSNANCFRGGESTPAPESTASAFRRDGGCFDTLTNSADFFVHAPFPRNISSPVNNCSAGVVPEITISDYGAIEGDSGSQVFPFIVTLSAPALSSDVVFDIATQNQTASVAHQDYEARNLSNQIIPAGQTSFIFEVVVNGDTAVEPAETFLANLTNVRGAAVTRPFGVGTIDNDDLPSLRISDASVAEGNAGSTTIEVTVSLSSPAAAPVFFDIATLDGTATISDNDYLAHSLTTQTIEVGQQTHSFKVPVLGDLRIEPDETFLVTVSNVYGAVVADGESTATIRNDDSATLSINDVTVNEGDSAITSARFIVTSSLAAPAEGIQFSLETHDKTATAASEDYISRNPTHQIIPAGQSTFSYEVQIKGDSIVELDESFLVKITNAANATIIDEEGVGTILNDDEANLVVSQLYPGGGNSGATFTNDFVEIFNRGSTTVDFAEVPYSIQYAGATANFGSNKVNLDRGRIAPGQYFLVQLAGGANGAPLPTPDASGGIAMAATAGKVALVKGTTPLGDSGCPRLPTIADFVGYGGSASCFIGAGPAPAPSATAADVRRAGGCSQTDNNGLDFFVHLPAPRNSSAPINNCSSDSPANLSISDASLAEGESGTRTVTFVVRLSAAMRSTDVTFDIATQNQTATTANNDYETRNLKNQIIPAGQLTYAFAVTINGDKAVEPDETFLVALTNVVGANVTNGAGIGTIENDDLPTLTVTDVSMPEGDSGTKAFTFVIGLSGPAPKEVTFDVATQNGTATFVDNDFVGQVPSSQRINQGEQSMAFSVIVNGDLKIEADETFHVNISSVNGAIPTDVQGLGTIQNDDSPKLSVNDVSIIEGDAGAKHLTFTVSSSVPAPAAGIRFNVATEDVSAAASTGDYVAKSLTNQMIPAGQSTYSFEVIVNGDKLVERDETFAVRLTSVQGAVIADNLGIATIQNDDVAILVVSQLYGGGGNSGAEFRNDFIEIFNRGDTIVDLNGWSVQYSSATGSTWSTTALCPATNCLVLPGRYFLVQQDRGSGGTAELPAPDASGTIAMTAAAGKVALVSSLSPLTGACPTSANLIDLVGYGATVSCFEGSAPAPSASNSLAEVRKGGGCVDNANNSSDLFTHAPSPRNSSFPANNCSGQETDLIVNDLMVVEGDGAAISANFTVRLLGSTPSAVTVNYATSNGTAQAPADFEAVSGQLVFLPGETTKTISVNIHGDTVDEPDETFFLNLLAPTNAALLDHQGIATITDNDVPPLLTIDDVAFAEGNGPNLCTFTVHLSAPALAGGVSFDIATLDGTALDGIPATEGNDYSSRSVTGVIIPAGQQEYAFDVIVNGDLIDEPDETFFVKVTNVSGATPSDVDATATIMNDDSAVLSIGDVNQVEGNAGATVFNFTVSSSMPAPNGGISFDVSTTDQTANDGSPVTEDDDYEALSSAGVTIPEGQTSVVVPVSVKADKLVEKDETFLLTITNISGASANDSQAVGTIQNDDLPHLIISQIYPGGGNAGATYTNDFIELFNRGSTTIDFVVTPYSLQYIGASGFFGSISAANKTNIISGSIGPGQYFLVQGASGGSNGLTLPSIDALGSIAMSATGGKVALVLGTASLPSLSCPGDDASPPTNPSGNNIVDFVGYGSGANSPNCFEGLGAVAFSTSTAGGLDPDARSVVRVASCVDNNNNSTDFTNPTTAPVARNKTTVPVLCL